MITHLIIFTILTVITLSILCATIVDVYNNNEIQQENIEDYNYHPNKIDSYNFKLDFWHILLMAILYICPIVNIVCFVIGIITYCVYTTIDPEYSSGRFVILRLQDKNIIAKLFNKVIIFIINK